MWMIIVREENNPLMTVFGDTRKDNYFVHICANMLPKKCVTKVTTLCRNKYARIFCYPIIGTVVPIYNGAGLARSCPKIPVFSFS